MEEIKALILEVSNSDSPVMIYGETGTGKEMIAESIHSEGKRRAKNFIAQNCAAIPPHLLESMFFGTEKGGFTGAESREGLFEMASGGTLFLDEINSLDLGTCIIAFAFSRLKFRLCDSDQRIFFFWRSILSLIIMKR